MIRILIVSDSHGRSENVEKAIKQVGKIDFLIHLGDVCDYPQIIEGMAHVPVYMVAGNNDFGRGLLDRNIIQFGGHRVYMTHGHRQGVYSGVQLLKSIARDNNCDIVMFGHTHKPYFEEGDVTVLNPGSISEPRQAGREKTFVLMKIDDNDKVSYSIQVLEE